MSHSVLAEVLTASKQWIKHFNQGDVDYCVSGYLPDAVMLAALWSIQEFLSSYPERCAVQISKESVRGFRCTAGKFQRIDLPTDCALE